MEWMLYFVIVSSPLTVTQQRPVGSPEQCVEVAYEQLRHFIKDHGTPISAFNVLCAPEGEQK